MLFQHSWYLPQAEGPIYLRGWQHTRVGYIASGDPRIQPALVTGYVSFFIPPVVHGFIKPSYSIQICLGMRYRCSSHNVLTLRLSQLIAQDFSYNDYGCYCPQCILCSFQLNANADGLWPIKNGSRQSSCVQATPAELSKRPGGLCHSRYLKQPVRQPCTWYTMFPKDERLWETNLMAYLAFNQWQWKMDLNLCPHPWSPCRHRHCLRSIPLLFVSTYFWVYKVEMLGRPAYHWIDQSCHSHPLNSMPNPLLQCSH